MAKKDTGKWVKIALAKKAKAGHVMVMALIKKYKAAAKTVPTSEGL